MAIEAGLAAKVIAGTGAAGLGATALYFGGDYISNSLSKYETALINFLRADDDHDFVFSSEPESINLDFSTSSPQKATVSVKVQLSAGTNTIFKGKGGSTVDVNKLTEIKKLNNGNWTWECSFTFSKSGNDVESINSIKADLKDRMLKDTNKGLFGILKKDLSSDSGGTTGGSNKQKLKKVKIDFIQKCGYARGIAENKKVNGEANATNIKIDVPEIKFVKDGNNSQLTHEDKTIFDYWFKEEYATA